MAVASYTWDLDQIGSTTLQLLRPKIAEAHFEAIPVLKWLLERNRVSTANGGRWIETRIRYAPNKTVAPYSHWEDMNVFPTESLTGARYAWRQYAGSICISGFEEAINAGESQLISLLGESTENLQMSFKDTMASDIFATAANKDLNRQILGLDQIIENAGTFGSLGGINRNTYTWWRNQQGTLDYPDAVSAGDDRPLWTAMTNMMNKCRRQMIPADDMLIVTTQEVFEKFELENRDILRYQLKDQKSIDLGWGDAIRFKNVRMVWDDKCYSTSATLGHRMYFISAPNLSFEIHPRRNFTMTKFREPLTKDGKVAFMYFMGQMTSNNNKHHGVITIDLAAS